MSATRKPIGTLERFGVLPTAACMTCTVVHPLDVIRIRMQLDSEGGGAKAFRNPLHCATTIAKEQGVKGIYAGLEAGLFRQVCYGSPRMALYTIGLSKIAEPGKPPSFLAKLTLGSAAGAAASVLGVPADVVMVRMAADAKAPAVQRRNYAGVFQALGRIAREEGIRALWSGTGPTMARAMLLNAGQLGVYSEAKECLAPLWEKGTGTASGLVVQLASGLCSATAATVLSCPADVIKSRLQNASSGQYAGAVDAAQKLLKHEGVFALWKGAGPSVMKLALQSVISLVILDNLTFALFGQSAL